MTPAAFPFAFSLFFNLVALSCLPGPYAVLTKDTMPQTYKRKRSWSRAVFSNLQRKGLEKRFEIQKYVTKPDRKQLAAMLGLTDAQVRRIHCVIQVFIFSLAQKTGKNFRNTHRPPPPSPDTKLTVYKICLIVLMFQYLVISVNYIKVHARFKG